MLHPAAAVAAAAAAGLAAVPTAQAAAVHAVVFVDVVPSDVAPASAALAAYVRRAAGDPAVRAATLIRQSGLPNHFVLEETFTDADAYRRFIAQDWVRSFREALHPHLGSPWDERLGSVVSP